MMDGVRRYLGFVECSSPAADQIGGRSILAFLKIHRLAISSSGQLQIDQFNEDIDVDVIIVVSQWDLDLNFASFRHVQVMADQGTGFSVGDRTPMPQLRPREEANPSQAAPDKRRVNLGNT
jgi:hypothetical protein